MHGSDWYEGVPTDVWAVGQVTLILLLGSLPWVRTNRSDPRYADVLDRGLGPFLDTFSAQTQRISPLARMFLSGLLDPSPKFRTSIDMAVQHEWLAAARQRVGDGQVSQRTWAAVEQGTPARAAESHMPLLPPACAPSLGAALSNTRRSRFRLVNRSYTRKVPAQQPEGEETTIGTATTASTESKKLGPRASCKGEPHSPPRISASAIQKLRMLLMERNRMQQQAHQGGTIKAPLPAIKESPRVARSTAYSSCCREPHSTHDTDTRSNDAVLGLGEQKPPETERDQAIQKPSGAVRPRTPEWRIGMSYKRVSPERQFSPSNRQALSSSPHVDDSPFHVNKERPSSFIHEQMRTQKNIQSDQCDSSLPENISLPLQQPHQKEPRPAPAAAAASGGVYSGPTPLSTNYKCVSPQQQQRQPPQLLTGPTFAGYVFTDGQARMFSLPPVTHLPPTQCFPPGFALPYSPVLGQRQPVIVPAAAASDVLPCSSSSHAGCRNFYLPGSL